MTGLPIIIWRSSESAKSVLSNKNIFFSMQVMKLSLTPSEAMHHPKQRSKILLANEAASNTIYSNVP